MSRNIMKRKLRPTLKKDIKIYIYMYIYRHFYILSYYISQHTNSSKDPDATQTDPTKQREQSIQPMLYLHHGIKRQRKATQTRADSINSIQNSTQNQMASSSCHTSAPPARKFPSRNCRKLPLLSCSAVIATRRTQQERRTTMRSTC